MRRKRGQAPEGSMVPLDLREYFLRRQVWRRKPQIRLVYRRWIDRIRRFLPSSGPILEVGSGSGLLRDFLPDVLLSDVADLPWIDLCADGLAIPFRSGTLGGVIGLDLLHHLSEPHGFLTETERVLRSGGRALFIEPYITLGSFLPYRMLHHEPVCFREYSSPGPNGSCPWNGNLASANLVFGRDISRWQELHPALAIVRRELFSVFGFPCAGGFKPRALAPLWLLRFLVQVDDHLGSLMRLVAFRIMVVLEKQ